MIGSNKFGTCLSSFANCGDRFCPQGYGGGERTLEGMLKAAASIDGLDGVELMAGRHVHDGNVGDIAALLSDSGLELCLLVPDVWGSEQWGKGSLAAPDSGTRQAAIDEIRQAMDTAAALKCPYIDVWFGQDGYDYCFQADYPAAYDRLIAGLDACARHNDAVRILIEYKPFEPRKRCFVDSAAKVLLLLKDLDNVGVLFDTGHALQGGENMAEAACLLAQHGKLDYIHLNDNYGGWDDDMLVGAVHVPATIEFFYWLRRLGYDGWLTLDIYPCREDGPAAVNECREWIHSLCSASQHIATDDANMALESGDACKAMALMRKALRLQPRNAS